MSQGIDWDRFWIAEADLMAMPITYVGVLVEYFQAQRPITAGNTFDRIHASYLVKYDRLVTADVDFYDALVFVKAQLPNLRGSPLLVNRHAGGSPLAELQRVI
jgi:hypothetical protein